MKDRILISNIPCWDDRGSDTITNLFEEYGADNIANIYFKAGTPVSRVCNNYFYISENSVIKSIFNRKIKTGRIVKKNTNTDTENSKDIAIEDKRLAFWSKHRLWVVLLLRELLWILGKWKTKELESFIYQFNPTKLFIPIEGYGYFNRISVYLIKLLQIPVYSIMWDDNFTYKQYPFNIFYRLHRFWLRHNIKKIITLSETVFVISPKMKEELDSQYGIESVILTKGARITDSSSNLFKPPYKMIYAGKLNLGRINSIKLIINSINSIIDGNLFFDIYSQTALSKRDIKYLNTKNSHFHGSVPRSELDNIITKYDIIVLAEALQGKEKSVARLSFSTKTTDSLATGKCVLCVCPKDNATYEYLMSNQAAFCASNKQEIIDFFSLIKEHPEELEKYANNARVIVQRNHEIEHIRNILSIEMNLEA